MNRPTQTPKFRRRAITAAAVVGTLLGATGIAGATSGAAVSQTASAVSTAQTDDNSTTVETDDTTSDHGGRGDHESTEETLTGALAEQVGAAALAAVPGGTVEHVETDDDGAAYEAHMTDADGNRVTVTFDESITIVEIIQDGGRGHGGRGHGGRGHDGHGDRGSGTEEALTGALAEQVSAAALAAVPGGTVEQVETDDDGAAYEAHMTDADGNRVTVTFDESITVVEIIEGR